MSKLKFGDKVFITKKYIRNNINLNKEYVSEGFNADGLFLGFRMITNGYSDCWIDDGCRWIATERFKVGLVAINEHINPLYVPIDAISLR